MKIKELPVWGESYFRSIISHYSFSSSFALELDRQLGEKLVELAGLEVLEEQIGLGPEEDISKSEIELEYEGRYQTYIMKYFQVEYRSNSSFLRVGIDSVNTYEKPYCIIAWYYQNEKGEYIEINPENEIPDNGNLKFWFEEFPERYTNQNFMKDQWEIYPPVCFTIKEAKENLGWWDSEFIEFLVYTKEPYDLQYVNKLYDILDIASEIWYQQICEETEHVREIINNYRIDYYQHVTFVESVMEDLAKMIQESEEDIDEYFPADNQKIYHIDGHKFLFDLRLIDGTNIDEISILYILKVIEYVLDIEKVVISPGYELSKFRSKIRNYNRIVKRDEIEKELEDPVWRHLHQTNFYIIFTSEKELTENELDLFTTKWHEKKKHYIYVKRDEIDSDSRFILEENDHLLTINLDYMPNSLALEFYEFFCVWFEINNFTVTTQVRIY